MSITGSFDFSFNFPSMTLETSNDWGWIHVRSDFLIKCQKWSFFDFFRQYSVIAAFTAPQLSNYGTIQRNVHLPSSPFLWHISLLIDSWFIHRNVGFNHRFDWHCDRGYWKDMNHHFNSEIKPLWLVDEHLKTSIFSGRSFSCIPFVTFSKRLKNSLYWAANSTLGIWMMFDAIFFPLLTNFSASTDPIVLDPRNWTFLLIFANQVVVLLVQP